MLLEDTEYELAWENGDGEPHDLAIVTDDGEVVDDLHTDLVDEEGEGDSLSFEPTEEMAHYVCTEHEDEQRGDFSFVVENDAPARDDE